MKAKQVVLGDEAIRRIIQGLRVRLGEYRVSESEVSIHLNAIDLVINLVEYGMDSVTQRAIQPHEEWWFNVGRTLDDLYRNSEWYDMVDGYYQLVEFAVTRSYFRSQSQI